MTEDVPEHAHTDDGWCVLLPLTTQGIETYCMFINLGDAFDKMSVQDVIQEFEKALDGKPLTFEYHGHGDWHSTHLELPGTFSTTRTCDGQPVQYRYTLTTSAHEVPPNEALMGAPNELKDVTIVAKGTLNGWEDDGESWREDQKSQNGGFLQSTESGKQTWISPKVPAALHSTCLAQWKLSIDPDWLNRDHEEAPVSALSSETIAQLNRWEATGSGRVDMEMNLVESEAVGAGTENVWEVAIR